MTTRIFAAAVLVLSATIASITASGRDGWTSAQLEELRSMSLAELESLPRDPTNRVADDPRRGSRSTAVLRHATKLKRPCRVQHVSRLIAGSRTGSHSQTAWAPPRGGPCRSPEWRDRHFCSGMAEKTACGRRRSGRSRVQSSTAARARNTRTSWPTPTRESTRRFSERCRISRRCLDLPVQ
jgi:hypothetical protein